MIKDILPFVLSLSKHVPPRNPPFDKLRANGLGVFS